MRPFDRAFDPAGIQSTGKFPCSGFSFLQHAILEPLHGLDHCNVFDPRAVDVPWPTSFPAVAQCKYWKDAEAAARNIMQEIEGATPLNQGSLPEEMRNHSSRVQKRNELLETAVTAPINMFPAANRQCARILAKANVLIFMHDDVIESTSIEGMTIIDRALADFTESRTKSPGKIWKNEVFADFATEVLQEDPIAGPNLLKGILTWVQHTRNHLPGEMKFETFLSYIDYRIKDFAVDFCDAAIMMACKIYLSPLQMEPLASLHILYMTHFSLTNDLYSYDKEALAMQGNGSALLNGIKVLQDILGTSVQGTKIILRTFLWDLEARISEEYESLVSSGRLTPDQARFARAMIETLAGNMFYSATASRYCAAACGA